MLFRSILATIELHKSGATGALLGAAKERDWTDEERELLTVAQVPYGQKDWLVQQYGLDPFEVRSIEAYSLPNKNDVGSEYYMGPSPRWGRFENGWGSP